MAIDPDKDDSPFCCKHVVHHKINFKYLVFLVTQRVYDLIAKIYFKPLNFIRFCYVPSNHRLSVQHSPPPKTTHTTRSFWHDMDVHMQLLVMDSLAGAHVI